MESQKELMRLLTCVCGSPGQRRSLRPTCSSVQGQHSVLGVGDMEESFEHESARDQRIGGTERRDLTYAAWRPFNDITADLPRPATNTSAGGSSFRDLRRSILVRRRRARSLFRLRAVWRFRRCGGFRGGICRRLCRW